MCALHNGIRFDYVTLLYIYGHEKFQHKLTPMTFRPKKKIMNTHCTIMNTSLTCDEVSVLFTIYKSFRKCYIFCNFCILNKIQTRLI